MSVLFVNLLYCECVFDVMWSISGKKKRGSLDLRAISGNFKRSVCIVDSIDMWLFVWGYFKEEISVWSIFFIFFLLMGYDNMKWMNTCEYIFRICIDWFFVIVNSSLCIRVYMLFWIIFCDMRELSNRNEFFRFCVLFDKFLNENDSINDICGNVSVIWWWVFIMCVRIFK